MGSVEALDGPSRMVERRRGGWAAVVCGGRRAS